MDRWNREGKFNILNCKWRFIKFHKIVLYNYETTLKKLPYIIKRLYRFCGSHYIWFNRKRQMIGLCIIKAKDNSVRRTFSTMHTRNKATSLRSDSRLLQSKVTLEQQCSFSYEVKIFCLHINTGASQKLGAVASLRRSEEFMPKVHIVIVLELLLAVQLLWRSWDNLTSPRKFC